MNGSSIYILGTNCIKLLNVLCISLLIQQDCQTADLIFPHGLPFPSDFTTPSYDVPKFIFFFFLNGLALVQEDKSTGCPIHEKGEFCLVSHLC